MRIRRPRYRQLFYLAGFVLLILIPILSLMPMPELPDVIGTDKHHHFLAYAALTFCYMQWIESWRSRFVVSVAFVTMGAIIEYVQPFVNRQFDYGDMVANALGVVLGLVLGAIACALKKRYIRRP